MCQQIDTKRGHYESAKPGDSNSWKADATSEKPLDHNQARHGPNRRSLRRAGQRNPSKMARKLPQNQGPGSDSLGRENRGTLLRSCFKALARLERAAVPARPTAALPQIAKLEPVKAPFPRAQRRSLGSSSLAQRSAAVEREWRV